MLGYVPPVDRRPAIGSIADGAAMNARAASLRLAHARGIVSARGGGSRRARRGLILDLDDTLYPRERFVRSGLAAVARHLERTCGIAAEAAYGLMTRAFATRGNGAELQVICDRFGLSTDVIPSLVHVYRMHMPTLFLARDVEDTLRRLRGEGWALAILTNGMPSVQFRKVAALGLSTLVDEILYAEEHAPGGKPSPAPFRAALQSLELTAGDCICVGDDPVRDVQGARALGLGTVRLRRPAFHVAPGDEADAVIDSIAQLPGTLAMFTGALNANVA